MQQEIPESTKLVEDVWVRWNLDHVAAGLDYFLLHCVAAFGVSQTLDWVTLCDPESRTIHALDLNEAALLIEKLELVWRRRLRSTPGWELHRAAWVNKCNRVKKRAKDLIEEKRHEETRRHLEPILATAMRSFVGGGAVDKTG